MSNLRLGIQSTVDCQPFFKRIYHYIIIHDKKVSESRFFVKNCIHYYMCKLSLFSGLILVNILF